MQDVQTGRYFTRPSKGAKTHSFPVRGRSERVTEGVPLWYIEVMSEVRTKLVACFNILLRFDDDIDKGGQTLSAFTVGHAKLEPVKSLFRYGGGNERGLGHIRI